LRIKSLRRDSSCYHMSLTWRLRTLVQLHICINVVLRSEANTIPQAAKHQTQCTGKESDLAFSVLQTDTKKGRTTELLNEEENGAKEKVKESVTKNKKNNLQVNLSVIDKSIATMEIGWNNSDTQKALLQQLKMMVQNQLMPYLLDENSNDQQEYNQKKKSHTDCQTHANEFKANNPVGPVDDAKQKHKKCRKFEKHWSAYTSLSLASDACPSGADLQPFGNFYHNHELLCEAMEAAKYHKKQYNDSPPAGIVQECDLEQRNYENKYCMWRVPEFYICNGLEECLAQIGLSAFKESLRTRLTNRRALWRTLKKFICRIEHLNTTFGELSVSNFNVTDACENVTVNTSILDLALEVPSHTPCVNQTPVVMPGGATCAQWRAQEYEWDATTHIMPTMCEEQCNPPMPVPYQPPTAECSSESTQCILYNHHQDACGHYDTPTFVASAACCACTTTTTTTTQAFTPMGRPSVGVSSHCTMEDGWFKVVGSASCMLGNPDGTPLVVDYTQKKYTTYAFTIKLGSSDGNNAHNGNISPHGGFKPCNRDGTSSSRGSSPELWFIDRGGDWGWGLYNGGWGHNARYLTKDTSSDPNGQKELHFEVSMKWESNHYTIHSWKVADDNFPAYNGKDAGCNPSSNYAFTPRLWAYDGGSTFYMKNLIVSQSDTPPTP